MTFPNDLYERAGRSICDCPGWEDDAYGCSDCQDLAANVLNMAAQNHPRSAVDAPEAPGQPGRGEEGSGGRTAALCIGCGWCCQSTPRERRGEAHQGCH